MEFKRPTGFFGSRPRNWIDKNLPKCPMCKTPSLWEIGMEASLTLNRYHFRCPNCKAVLSIPVASVGGGPSPALMMLKAVASKNLKIESVGNQTGMDERIGKEYSIPELQAWASQ